MKLLDRILELADDMMVAKIVPRLINETHWGVRYFKIIGKIELVLDKVV